MLTVSIQNFADTVVLRCQGRLVRGEEASLLCAAVRRHGQNLVLDLRDVTAIDAAGIGALVSLQAAGVYLKLMNPPEAVRSVLRLTGLNSAFEVCETESIGDLTSRATARDPGTYVIRSLEPASASLAQTGGH